MFGSCTISTKEIDGDVNSIITIANSTPALNTDLATNIAQPQEELAFRFVFNRDASDTTKGPAFDGYQVKSLPAVNRARQLTIPLVNYDFETDRYGVQNGYEGRAFVRLQELENLEAAGDTIVIQDFTTGEQVVGLASGLHFSFGFCFGLHGGDDHDHVATVNHGRELHDSVVGNILGEPLKQSHALIWSRLLPSSKQNHGFDLVASFQKAFCPLALGLVVVGVDL